MGTYLRLTPAMLDVLGCLFSDRGQVWGLRVSMRTGRPTGTVYPLLERLERSGFVSSSWEDTPERPGPRRRLYVLTKDGRTWAEQQLIRKGRSAAALEGST